MKKKQLPRIYLIRIICIGQSYIEGLISYREKVMLLRKVNLNARKSFIL